MLPLIHLVSINKQPMSSWTVDRYSGTCGLDALEEREVVLILSIDRFEPIKLLLELNENLEPEPILDDDWLVARDLSNGEEVSFFRW